MALVRCRAVYQGSFRCHCGDHQSPTALYDAKPPPPSSDNGVIPGTTIDGTCPVKHEQDPPAAPPAAAAVDAAVGG
eukprot:57189-Eustigmatos_ZCMA.PRE.1